MLSIPATVSKESFQPHSVLPAAFITSTHAPLPLASGLPVQVQVGEPVLNNNDHMANCKQEGGDLKGLWVKIERRHQIGVATSS